MREIKFRAYFNDKHEPRYLNDCDFAVVGNGIVLERFGYSDDFIVSKKIFTLEQFTGLQDKNGVDIYEGDIVRRHIETYESDYSGYTSFNGYYEGKIKFYRTKGFILECYKKVDVLDESEEKVKTQLHLTTNTLEVIGNIHD